MRIVLMDGECTFCQASVQFIMKRDRGAFHFASLQSELGHRLVQQYQVAHIDSVILIEQGKAYLYSDAALRIAAQLNAPWSLLKFTRVVPRLIRDMMYRLIAKNRYYLLKKQSVCHIPTENERARFLT